MIRFKKKRASARFFYIYQVIKLIYMFNLTSINQAKSPEGS